MKKIRARFICYSGQRLEDNYYYRLLRRHYEVEISDDPDFLFVGQIGDEHFVYDDRCVRIITIGENCAPDFNHFDYAIGGDGIEFGDRYLQLPAWRWNPHLPGLDSSSGPTDEALLKRDFCSFVVSNCGGDDLRAEFFRRLSKYRPVASGGRFLNNVGGPVRDKMKFISCYKFNIAFENSAVPGYSTEKIIEPLAAFTLPIYYGDPKIHDWLRPECMVRVKDRNDVERAVEEIVALDHDDAAYLARIHASRLQVPVSEFEDRIVAFLRHICDQDPKAAKRTCDFGHQLSLRANQRHIREFYNLFHYFKTRKILAKRTRCD